MKIVICCSISAAKNVMEIADKLIKSGHEVVLPDNLEKYADGSLEMENAHESTQNKIEGDLIRKYFEKIENCDVVLIVNQNKKGIKNYIGGNSFLEMGFAHVINKKIYLLNNIPNMFYTDEIKAMQPIVINGDLSKIK